MRNGEEDCWDYIRRLHKYYKEAQNEGVARLLWETVVTFCKHVLGIETPTRSKRTADGNCKLDDLFREKLGVGFSALEMMKSRYSLTNEGLKLTPIAEHAVRLRTKTFTVKDLQRISRLFKAEDRLRGEGRRLIVAIGARVFGTRHICGNNIVTIGDETHKIGTWYEKHIEIGPTYDYVPALVEEQNIYGVHNFEGPLVQWVVDQFEKENDAKEYGGIKWWENDSAALALKRNREAENALRPIPERFRGFYRGGKYGYPNGFCPDQVQLEIEEYQLDIIAVTTIHSLEVAERGLILLGIFDESVVELQRLVKEHVASLKKPVGKPTPAPPNVAYVPPEELRKLPEMAKYKIW